MVWAGKDAERLRLQGACRQADFELMCQGEDPRTGMRLMLRDCGSQRRICFFAQVSAPKDVSIACLVGGDRRIATWWKEAVAETVREIEAVAATRVRKAGACEDRVTGSMVAAVVMREASRALDPQLHTHVAVMNLTFDPVEKRWKGLQPSGFFRHQVFLREVCYNAMARRVIEGAYRVESVRGAGFRLAGISASQRETFSKRQRRILEREKEEGARSQDALQAITAETRESRVRMSVAALRARWTEEAGPELEAVRAMVANAVAGENGRPTRRLG
jgi:conjugative relaxase-like TrwC/TraI family protein